MLDKLMPYNLEAECAILGSIILDNKTIYLAKANIKSENFYLEAHRHIFNAMINLSEDFMAIDFITLKEELSRLELLEITGGMSYLSKLTDGIPHGINVEYYCRIVASKAALREGIRLSAELQKQCYDDNISPLELFGEYYSKLGKLAQNQQDKMHDCYDTISSTFELICKRRDNPCDINGVPSGISGLDRHTNGFQKGDLIVIAARTGIGKTAFALNILLYSIRRNLKVALFSLEMSREQIGLRIIGCDSGVDIWQLKTGHIPPNRWDSVSEAASKLKLCNFWLFDKSISLDELDGRIRQLSIEKGGLDLVIVDYLQLVQVSSKRIENRTQEVTEISRGLKAIAMDLNIPVIALSQLNADGEVRESRAIEQDASLVIIIEMDKDELRTLGLVPAELKISKNRNGSLDNISVNYRKAITRFEQELL
jgi:replicative DNA helicase